MTSKLKYVQYMHRLFRKKQIISAVFVVGKAGYYREQDTDLETRNFLLNFKTVKGK